MNASADAPRRLGDLLSDTAARFPQKEALVFGEERVSWAELEQRVDRLAAAFLHLGVQRGDRVGIVCTTRPEHLYTYLAAARIGAVLAGFNVLQTPPELVRLVDLIRPTLMIGLGNFRDQPLINALRPSIDAIGCIRHWIVVGREAAPPDTLCFEDLLRSELQPSAVAERQRAVSEHDPVLIVFTSGSTGLPKGAVLTHANIIANIAVEVRQFQVTDQDRFLVHLPMCHVAGATETTVPALMTGATLVLMDHFHPVRTLELVERERITVLGQVPTMFIMELNLPNFAEFDLRSLRVLIVAGAATPAPIMARMLAIGPVITGYGLTEVGGFVTYTDVADDPDTIARTVGKVAPEFELRIVDAQRRELPTGEPGEVAVRGPCVMPGYFEDPAATTAVIDAQGWCYTGDIGRLDQRGYLTLVDRQKEMYITGGYNVYPREVEERISQHPAVALVAVLGVEHEVMGEVGWACIVAKPGHSLIADTIKAHCQKELAEYKVPREVHFFDALPLTSLGKVDKIKLRSSLANHGDA